jgi:hypothetical protein
MSAPAHLHWVMFAGTPYSYLHICGTRGKAPNTTKAIRQSGLCLTLLVAPREAKSSPRPLIPSRVTARKCARFAPLSLGGKFRYTIAKSLASSSHSSFPESSDRGPGFGHRYVHAECGCGVADDLAHDESDVYCPDSNRECVAVFPSGVTCRFHRRYF